MMIDFIVDARRLMKGMNFALSYPYNYSRHNRMIADVWEFVQANRKS